MRFQSINELMMALNRGASRRPATSQWECFVADFKGFGLDIKHGFQSGCKTVAEYLRQQDWRALSQRPLTKKIAAGLGAASLLAAVIVFSVHGSRKSRVAGSTVNPSTSVAANQEPNSPISATLAPTKVDAPKGINNSATNPGNASGRATEKNPSFTRTEAAAPASSRVAPPESKVTRAPRNGKAQSTAHVAATPSAAAQPSVAPPASDAAASDETKSKTDDTASDAPASPQTPAVFAAPYEGVAPDASSTAPGAPGLYLEVGSFKDSTWADEAVEKLKQLGFHSFAVHKAHLWLQSYQVKVGPYADKEALEDARKNLVLQGFKPHPVK
jgi:hypothetical protein